MLELKNNVAIAINVPQVQPRQIINTHIIQYNYNTLHNDPRVMLLSGIKSRMKAVMCM